MKKIFSFLAMALLLVSCSSDDFNPAIEGTEQEVAISIELPEQIQSRGMGGESSALGGAKNTGKAMEFNVAVYYENETTPAWVGTKTAEAGENKVTFTPKMVLGKSYKVIAFASSTPVNWEADGVQNINLSTVLNNEDEDAYSYNNNLTAEAHMSITLTRPFGKLRIVTEDYQTAIEKHFKSQIKSIKVTYNTALPTVFDPVTNSFVTTESAATQTVFADDAFSSFSYSDESGETKTLVVDYIPSDAAGSVLTFTVDVEFVNGYTFTRQFKSDIPVKRNYLTTLRGNFFLSDAELEVYFDPAFADEEVVNYNIIKAFVEGGEFTLDQDYTMNGTLVLEAGKSLVLNLNGKTITNKVENKSTDVIIVKEGATLTINGEGNVTAVTGNDGYAIISEGKLIINGGTYRSGLDASNDGNCTIYARGNGQIYINGGDFSTPEGDDKTYVINKKGADVATTVIEIRGGTFKNFNPAGSPADGANTNYVAEGYKVVQDGNYYTVVDASTVSVATNEELEAALSQDVENISIFMTADASVDVTAWSTLAFGGASTKTITIEGNNHTLTFNQTNSDWNNIATSNNAKLIIKNATIDNSGHNDGPWNRHDLNFACDVELENVVSNKAIALKASGKLTKVTINDANTGDTYALWIQPNGQTVTLDGCEIDMIAATDGRGIKIDEQYVTTPAKVTLNVSNTVIKTEEKAAILVKSVAGADINLSNVDITNVAADNVNTVWCDEASGAYYELINVNGGTMILEGDFSADNGIISTVAQLQQFADEVNVNKNALAGVTIKLVNDLDLAGIDWEPIGQTGATTFNGVFDGQNHTIYNLTVNSVDQTGAHYSSGLFGWVESHTTGCGHLKNIKIDGAIIKGNHNCGALVGYITQGTALVENCHVNKAEVYCYHANKDACGDKAGALIGNATAQTPVSNCSASNSSVAAGRDAGQVMGAGNTTLVTGCTATKVTVTALDGCTDSGAGSNIKEAVIGRVLQ